MRENFRIDYAQHRIPKPEPLGNTEREILQDLAMPGLPLWKVLRELHDYREALVWSLAQPDNDLDSESGVKAMKKTQAAVGAITLVLEKFEAALQSVAQETEQGK